MKIHLFGAATPTGQALHNLAKVDLVGYSQSFSPTSWLHPADFSYQQLFILQVSIYSCCLDKFCTYLAVCLLLGCARCATP